MRRMICWFTSFTTSPVVSTLSITAVAFVPDSNSFLSASAFLAMFP